MDKRCKNCKHFQMGMSDEQRKKFPPSRWTEYADGLCDLYFPRGYVGRKPPHAAHSTGKCFQWVEQEAQQMEMSDFLEV